MPFAGPQSDPDWAKLPASAGVAVFRSDDRATLVATSADVRALAHRRLGPPPADDEASVAGSARADLRPITTRVDVVQVGSAFEADWVYLDLARDLMPEVYKAVAERRRAWFVHVDPRAEFPRFSKTHLGQIAAGGKGLGLVAPRSASTSLNADDQAPPDSDGLLLGPISDKDSAGRFIEALVDGFDLCRFHHILVKSPHGAACAYKELDRCPAPCDGSEPMETYRQRVAGSVAWTTSLADQEVSAVSLPVLVEQLNARMTCAAAEGRFELAAAARDRIKRIDQLGGKRFRHVREISQCRWLIVQPSGSRGIARVFTCLCGRTVRLIDVPIEDPAQAAEIVADACADAARSFEFRGLDQPMADNLGLVARWLFKLSSLTKSKAVGAILPIDAAGRVDLRSLRSAFKSLGRTPHEGDEAPDIEDQELSV